MARNVAHDDEGGADKPFETLRTAANIVVDIIRDNLNTTDLNNNKKETMVKWWAPYASNDSMSSFGLGFGRLL